MASGNSSARRSSGHWRIEVGQLQKVLDQSSEKTNPWDSCSIYRVPSHLLRGNEKLYRPTLVSIGPYHHNHPDLKPMDEHKVRSLSRFLNRSKRSLNDVKASLRCDVGQLMNSYEELDEEWRDQEDKFLDLMILDGCFLLEILRMMTDVSTDWYGQSDPVFGVRGRLTILNTLLNEIFMLENQVPFLVLEKLLAIEKIKVDAVQYLDEIFVTFPKVHELYQAAGDKPMHLLDFGRTKIVGKLSPRKLPSFEVLETKTASTYKKSGIIFKTSQTITTSGFKLEDNVLELPIVLLQLPVSVAANLQIYEILHNQGGLEIHSYFHVMGGLFQSAEDLKMLGIDSLIEVQRILNLLKFSEDEINFFIDSGTEVFPVLARLNEYHEESTKKWKMRIREWSSNLEEVYFNNPWTKVCSLSAALLLLSFTIWQTVFTSLSYYNPNG